MESIGVIAEYNPFHNGHLYHLKKIKEKLGKKGILFQAAAIGWDKEAIRKIYGNAYLDISSLEQLPIRLTKQLAKLLRRVN